MTAARKQAKPETAAPMKTPQIIPTANAYRTIPVSAVRLKRPRTKSGETVATTAPNAPPTSEDKSAPTRIMTKNPIAVLTASSVFIISFPYCGPTPGVMVASLRAYHARRCSLPGLSCAIRFAIQRRRKSSRLLFDRFENHNQECCDWPNEDRDEPPRQPATTLALRQTSVDK